MFIVICGLVQGGPDTSGDGCVAGKVLRQFWASHKRPGAHCQSTYEEALGYVRLACVNLLYSTNLILEELELSMDDIALMRGSPMT
jgi:hypothetical protein